MAPAGPMINIRIHNDDPTWILKIGFQLGIKMGNELVGFLQANLDVFAWTHSDICGICQK